MTKLLTSTWMTAVISAVLYPTTTVLVWKTPTPVNDASEAGEKTSKASASWEFTNPEADQLIAELKAEKKSLEKREQQLNDLAARLQAEHAELNQVTQSVHQLQAAFDNNVLRVQDEEVSNLKKLAKVYAAMPPESAANIFAQLEDTAVVKIMVFMKEAETAGILESLAKKGEADAKRAASLSERIRISIHRTNSSK